MERRYDHLIIHAVPRAARSASGDSGELPSRSYQSIRAQLVVTAASGVTPTLDVVIEDTLDGANWTTVGTFTQKSAAGAETITISAPVSPYLRVRWTMGGASPSFTFGVDLYSA